MANLNELRKGHTIFEVARVDRLYLETMPNWELFFKKPEKTLRMLAIQRFLVEPAGGIYRKASVHPRPTWSRR